MKKILLITCIATIASVAYGQTKPVKKTPVKSAQESTPQVFHDPDIKIIIVPKVINADVIGSAYIFGPVFKLKISPAETKANIESHMGDANAPNDIPIGKKLILAGAEDFSVTLKDEAGKQFRTYVSGPYHIANAVAYETYDSVKRTFLNKTFWLNTYTLHTYDAATGKYGTIQNDDVRFSSVKVTDVVLTGSPVNQFRLILQTEKGQSAFIDFTVDPDMFQGEGVSLDPSYPQNNPNGKIAKSLYTYNPVARYNITPAKKAIIAKGDISVGMSSDIFRLIKGEPSEINYSQYGSEKDEQWVYEFAGKQTYYYFTNGKLTARN